MNDVGRHARSGVRAVVGSRRSGKFHPARVVLFALAGLAAAPGAFAEDISP